MPDIIPLSSLTDCRAHKPKAKYKFDPRSTDIAWVDMPFAFPLVSQLERAEDKKQEHIVAHHFASPSFAVCVGGPGETQETFHIPRNRLTANSAYFATLINGSFKGLESANSVVTLDTEVDRLDAFKMFVDWLFLGDYTEPPPPANRGNGYGERCISHARVYVLAERLCAYQLKHLAFKKMEAQLQQTYVEFAGKWSANLNAHALVTLIKIVYPYTRDAYTLAEDPPVNRVAKTGTRVKFAPSPPPARDPMRKLLATYASSAVETLCKEAEFMRLLKGSEGCEEFAGDLLLRVKKGERIKSSDPRTP